MGTSDDQAFMAEALAEARFSLSVGGAPIGAALVKAGTLLGCGHNRLYQSGDPTSHAEMEAYRNAAERLASELPRAEIEAALSDGTVYTTAMPCEMCAGAIIRFNAARVVVGETRTHPPPETRPLMERQGIEVVVLEDEDCVRLLDGYLTQYPDRRAQWVTPRTPPLRL